VNYLDATTAANPAGDITLPLIMGGAVLTFYSFVGFEDIMNVAEEVKNPQRNLPLALLLAVGVASAVYILISLVAVSVMSPAELATSKQPLVDVVARAAPWFPTPLFSAVALFAVANTALLNFIMGSRLLYGMSNQGLFPSFFSAVHKQRKSPHRTVVLVGLLLIVLAFSGDISTLAKATSVLLLLCFTLVNSALVVLHKDRVKGSFEIPRAIPILGALVCVALLTQSSAAEWLVAGSLLALITVLYFLMRPSAKALDALGSLD
jgi:amino acid transporter